VKLAAIDIGSNSIHMIVIETTGELSFEVLDREKEMVFLGRSVFEHGRLSPAAIERGLEAITKLDTLARRHAVDEVRAVATAAVREADNGAELLRAVAERTGIVARVISGTEEARTIHMAVRSAIDLGARRGLVVDIGGGSLELMAGDARTLRLARSLKLGVQRLRARFGEGALGKRERRELERLVDELARDAVHAALDIGVETVIGTSGTVLALGQAAHRLAGGAAWTTATGQRVSLEALARLRDRLIGIAPAERATLDGIDAKRADSLHVGAVLLCRLLELARASELTLCEFSLREGIVIDWLERRASAQATVTDIRRRSVLELARRCGQDGPHSEHVAELALVLFDQTRELHRLDAADRKLLEYAALLHEIGQHIGYEGRDRHAAYIIANADLRGFNQLDRSVIALCARYHLKARPRRRDPELAALPSDRRRAVRVLSALLRIADGLDRSHHQLIGTLHCTHDERDVVIRAEARGDADLEIWSARRSAGLLERALRRRLRIDLESVRSLAG
jgi:exopolyphosphatase/guanosine-5'-triphosphate,3'-diphosphate pyrophosphatase